MAFLNKTGVERLWSHIISKLNNKVDKFDNKNGSKNDHLMLVTDADGNTVWAERTHYYEAKETLQVNNVSVAVSSNWANKNVFQLINIYDGVECTVTINGIEYACKAVDRSSSSGWDGWFTIGNGDLAGGFENTGEPFVIEWNSADNTTWFYHQTDGTYTVSVLVSENPYKTIDPNYLANNAERLKSLVTDGNGVAVWEDRLAYETVGEVVNTKYGEKSVTVNGSGTYTESLWEQATQFDGGKWKVCFDGVDYYFEVTPAWTLTFGGEDYPFTIELSSGMGTAFYTELTLTVSEANSTHTLLIGTVSTGNVVHHIDEKYIPDTIARTSNIPPIPTEANQYLVTDADGNRVWEEKLGYSGLVEIFNAAMQFEDFYGMNAYMQNVENDNQILSEGETCKVIWDGNSYTCTAYNDMGTAVIGNATLCGGQLNGNNEPFCYIILNNTLYVFSDTSIQHEIQIYANRVAKKIDNNYIDGDTVTPIIFHRKPTISRSEISAYNKMYSSDKITHVVCGGYIVKRFSDGVSTDASGNMTYDVTLLLENGTKYGASAAIENSSQEVTFNIRDFEYEGFGTMDSYDNSFNSTIVERTKDNHPTVTSLLVHSGKGDDTVMFKVESNGTKSNAVKFYGNGEVEAEALMLHSVTEDSTDKFKITVDDTGAVSTTNTEDSSTVRMMPEIHITEEDNSKVMTVVDGKWEASDLSFVVTDDDNGNITISI